MSWIQYLHHIGVSLAKINVLSIVLDRAGDQKLRYDFEWPYRLSF